MKPSKNKNQTKEIKKPQQTPLSKASPPSKKTQTPSDQEPMESSSNSTDPQVTEPLPEIPGNHPAVEELKKKLLYLQAEFENYKKHSIKEKSQLIKYGGQELVIAFLDILDNFDRALELQMNADNIESFKKGIQLTASELKSTLSRFHINPIECINQAFDPSIHEAIGSKEDPHTTPGHITKVFKKPYKFHDKIIRTGQVIVAKESKKKN